MTKNIHQNDLKRTKIQNINTNDNTGRIMLQSNGLFLSRSASHTSLKIPLQPPELSAWSYNISCERFCRGIIIDYEQDLLLHWNMDMLSCHT